MCIYINSYEIIEIVTHSWLLTKLWLQRRIIQLRHRNFVRSQILSGEIYYHGTIGFVICLGSYFILIGEFNFIKFWQVAGGSKTDGWIN